MLYAAIRSNYGARSDLDVSSVLLSDKAELPRIFNDRVTLSGSRTNNGAIGYALIGTHRRGLFANRTIYRGDIYMSTSTTRVDYPNTINE
jgi:hypothetical protein